MVYSSSWLETKTKQLVSMELESSVEPKAENLAIIRHPGGLAEPKKK